MSRDHQPIHIKEFNGLFRRGSADVVPIDHFRDCLNVRYDQLGFKQRGGLLDDLTQLSGTNLVIRVQTFTDSGQLKRLLVLDDSGKIFDLFASTVVPILDSVVWAGSQFIDFSAITLYDKVFITPHTRSAGKSGALIWVYDPNSAFGTISVALVNVKGINYTVNDVLTFPGGDPLFPFTIEVDSVDGVGGILTYTILTRGQGYKSVVGVAPTGGTGTLATFNTTILATARPIGGLKPTSGVTAANGAAGKVEAGVHLIRVAYETESGFITQGNATPTQYTAPGGLQINLTNIPIGPSGIAKRHILVTKTIAGVYSGNPEDYEFFFAPNGEIANNTATTLTIDFYNNDLAASADYLLDQLETVPAGVFINSYQGSMVSGGEAGKESVVRVSKPGEPESFSSIDGFFLVNPGDAGGGVKNGIEYRDLYFVFKSQRTYVTKNNGAEPATWDVNLVDAAIGTECFGISRVIDAQGNSLDRFVIADRSGLMMFDGSFRDKSLSWKIEDLWGTINQAAFNCIQVVIHPVKKEIYVNVPIGSAVLPTNILVADFKNGFDPLVIRWGIDKFGQNTINPTNIWVRSNRSSIDVTAELEILLKIPNFPTPPDFYTKMFTLKDNNPIDEFIVVQQIDWFIETGLLTPDDNGSLYHFNKVQMRAVGDILLYITVKGMDNGGIGGGILLPGITLVPTPGKEYFRLANLISEKCALFIFKDYLTLTDVNSVLINKITLYASEIYTERPN